MDTKKEDKTKKLRGELGKINHRVGGSGGVQFIETLSPIEIDKILKACKEAGLKFTGGLPDGCDYFTEHDMTHGLYVQDNCPLLETTEEIEI